MADSTDTPKAPTMREHIAVALAAHPFPGDYDAVPPVEVFTRPRYQFLAEQYLQQSDAVLTAISVPTDAMRAAALTALHHWAPIVDNDTILTKIYQAMIAAAREG